MRWPKTAPPTRRRLNCGLITRGAREQAKTSVAVGLAAPGDAERPSFSERSAVTEFCL